MRVCIHNIYIYIERERESRCIPQEVLLSKEELTPEYTLHIHIYIHTYIHTHTNI